MDRIEYDGVGELYISGITSIYEGETNHADRVVTVCQDNVRENVSDSQAYDFFEMADGPHNSYGGDHSYELFERAATVVWNALYHNESVILHCHMGQSRSVSVGTAALGRLLDEPRHEAFGLISDSRPQAHPDQLLMGHAQTYIEQHIDTVRPFENHEDSE